MKILITGGAGFIGSHLAETLLLNGDEVTILDDLSTGSYSNIEHIDDGERLRIIVDTVCDEKIVNECVKDAQIVFHLASAVGVNVVIDQPVRTIETIVGGTDTVMRSCARYRRPILITSTSEVYGKGIKVPFKEDDDCVMGPTTKRRWSYACAKALDEFLAMANWYHSRLPVVIARLFNTVGPRQTGKYGMVVPRFVRQGLKGDSITVYGDGEQSRCFAHVKDVVNALIPLIKQPEAYGQVFNIGNDEEISMAGLAKLVCDMTGNRSEIVFVPYKEAYGEGFDDMQRRVPDLTKIKNMLKYEPKHDLKNILRDVIDFEKKLSLSEL